jgi:aryl-alcohol dehydrogenase-like predicted oxidoreductase
VRHGKVRHIGVCNFSAGDLERAQGIAARTHWARVVCNQVHYALTSRDVEHGIAPVAKANDVALLVWSPLVGGYLSGKYTQGSSGETGRRTKLNFPPIDRAKADPVVRVLCDIATELNASLAQVALAWIQARREVCSVIVGARTPDQLAANLDAQQIALTAAQTERLNQVSQPNLPYPYWMQQFQEKDRVVV